MPNVSVRGICSIPGCGRPHNAHALCDMHLKRLRRNGDPLKRQRVEKGRHRVFCAVEGCEKLYHAQGYCDMHYKRWRACGDPGPAASKMPGGSRTPAARAARYAEKRGVVIVTCSNAECGQPFERPNRHGQPARYCSDGCRRRASVLRTKAWVEANPERAKELRGAVYAKYCALKRGATPPGEVFTLNEIYERDGGICYLCGLHVDPQHRSMDHVIPVSKGGAHARANVRLAHRRCNSRKNARILSA